MTAENLAALDAAETELRQRTEAEAERLARQRAEIIAGLEQTRRDAVRARLAELNDLIPANTARNEAARAGLLDAVRDGGNVIEVLTTIVETHQAHHALSVEASSMEATLGLPSRPAPRQLAVDPLALLADAINTVATSRVPQPKPLPIAGPPLSHEEQMARQRQRHHDDQLLAEFLGLSAEQIATFTADEHAAKVEEAKAERARREAEVAAASLANEQDRRRREPRFRTVIGA